MSLTNRINYFSWAALNYVFADDKCPACKSASTRPVKRKALVTVLFECETCQLRFRVPKDNETASRSFYQEKYAQGATTECPGRADLESLLLSQFVGSPNDFSSYIEVLRVLGMREGDVVFDYGASWGYGSWQLRKAGATVYSYEVSKPRSTYAQQFLDCQMLEALDQIPEPVDFFFSAHVIEHLPNPNRLWEAAQRVLKPSGKVVLFMPNGEPLREQSCSYYHLLWGQVHPLLLTQHALVSMAHRHGFSGRAFSSPYDLTSIKSGEHASDALAGEELLFVATRD